MTAPKTKKKAQPQPPTREELRTWLESKHCTLWGRSFTLVKEGTTNAIDYILETLEDFEEWRKAQAK